MPTAACRWHIFFNEGRRSFCYLLLDIHIIGKEISYVKVESVLVGVKGRGWQCS